MSDYVNCHGAAVDLTKVALVGVKPKPVKETHSATLDRSKAKVSLGFAVEGFSKEHLAAAKEAHEKLRTELWGRWEQGKLARGEKVIPEWDEATYMRTAKPKRVRSRPYEIESAADQCAELARKSGWLNVHVVELIRT